VKSGSLKQISVVIVEDHRMFREQLAHLIDKADDMMNRSTPSAHCERARRDM